MADAVAQAAERPGADGPARADAGRRPRRRRRGGARARARPGSRGSGSSCFGRSQPMLAQTADDVADALERPARPRSSGSSTARASRCTARATRCARSRGTSTTSPPACPRSSRRVRRCRSARVVLDGEVIALARRRPAAAVPGDDEPLRQRGSTCERCARAAALAVLLRLPARRRRRPARPAGCASGSPRSPAARPTSARAAARDRRPGGGGAFLDGCARARPRGRDGEGARAPYEAGRRGGSWLKVKRAHTLDLVVLAAEWGNGRRQGWLSNIHLGARDPRPAAS